MKGSEIDSFISRVESLPDSDIIAALATASDYTPEAMIVYEAEAKRRGIQPEAVRPVAQYAAQKRKDKLARSWYLKGIGERLYGERYFREDGSYQTTKWFILFYLPIYPIASFRVRRDDKGVVSVVDVLPIEWRQVLHTYFFVASIWIAVAIAVRLLDRYSFPFSEAVVIALLGLPFCFLFLARRRARRRAAG